MSQFVNEYSKPSDKIENLQLILVLNLLGVEVQTSLPPLGEAYPTGGVDISYF